MVLMFTASLRFLTTILILASLLGLYTIYFGGPFGPVFIWLAERIPSAVPISASPAALSAN